MSHNHTVSVLAVDDEPELCELTKSFLGLSEGIEVDTVCSVAEARTALGQKRYDVIVSDYQMPKEDGIQFLKSLRSKGDRIPFILFTGKGREEVVIEALNSGADFYLQKGGNPAAQYFELEHKVWDAVRLRRADRDLLEKEARLTRAQSLGNMGYWESNADEGGAHIWGSDESFCIFGLAKTSDNIIPLEQVEACILERERVHQALLDLIENNKRYDIEYEIAPANGKPHKIIHSVAEMVIDPEEDSKRVRGIFQDVTERSVLEKDLIRTKGMLEAIILQMPVGITVIEPPHGKIVYQNEEVAKLFRHDLFPTEGMEEYEKWQVFHLDGTPVKVGEHVIGRSLIDGIIIRDVVEKVLRGDGTFGYLSTTSAPVRDANGVIIAALGMNLDVTERIEMGQSLSENEEKFRHLFEMESDALFMIDQRDGHIMEVNGAAERLYGYSRSEMLQMKNTDLSAEPEETVRAMVGAATDIPLRYHRRKDGTRFPLEITANHFEWKGIPIILCAMRDIAERKQLEAAIEKGEEQYRAIFEESPFTIELYDAGGVLVKTNRSCLDLFGIEDAQEIGGFSLFADPNITEEHKNELRRGKTIRYEGPFDFDKVRAHGLYHTRRSGIIELDVMVTPLRREEESIIGYMVQIQDITERKRAEEALRESEARLQTLVQTIPDLVWLKDTEGVYISCNPMFELFYGAKEPVSQTP